MRLLRQLFNQRFKRPSAQHAITWTSINPSNEDEYVRRCLMLEFPEKPEMRTYRSEPLFASVLSPLNSGRYAQTITAAQKILPRYRDFDLLYKWLGSAYRSIGQIDKSYETLDQGLGLAKRKSLLLTDMGEIEFERGNLNEAVYWWSQALHCLLSNPVDYNAFLLLSYVAKGFDLSALEQELLSRVDALKGGQVRLEPTTANRLIKLSIKKKTGGIRKVLLGFQEKLAPNISSNRKTEIGNSGELLDQDLPPEIINLISILESDDQRMALVNTLITRSQERNNTIELLSKMIVSLPSKKQNISQVVIAAIKQGYGNVDIIGLLRLLWQLGDSRAVLIGQLAEENDKAGLEKIIREL